MKRVLIANRGEIAVRVIRGCQARGLETVAIYSDADRSALHVELADNAVHIGGAAPAESYLNLERILDAVRESGADAVHPGYGFLSENVVFARAVQTAGVTWIGPDPESIEAMGHKIDARETMRSAGVPIVPGADLDADDDTTWIATANGLGYPLLVKASAGGGGKGMRAVHRPGELLAAAHAARREAQNAFGDATIYLERLLQAPRHIEFQIFGDRQGQVVHLAERECSIQRRHQKIFEESPSVALSASLREMMGAAAVAAARAVNYVGAGTVEFLLEGDVFYFLEMNTRLQVEHPVTEVVLGVDLVAAQLDVAAGKPLPWTQEQLVPRGHAIEVRLYAEDAGNDFLPQSGTLLRYTAPTGPNIRHDGGFRGGDEIGTDYDPMLAKLIVYGETRPHALATLRRALRDWEIHGVVTNLSFLQELASHPALIAGETHTRFVDDQMSVNQRGAAEITEEMLIAIATHRALGGTALSSEVASGGSGAIEDSPWLGMGPWRSLSRGSAR